MDKIYAPRELGKLIGRTTQTLQLWDRKGLLKAHRTPTNRRYYTHDQYLQVIGQKAKEQKIVVYCRVSSAGQKNDLESQKQAVERFCIAAGKPSGVWLQDIGSGLNYKRKNFVGLMEMVGTAKCPKLSSPTKTGWCASATSGLRNSVGIMGRL